MMLTSREDIFEAMERKCTAVANINMHLRADNLALHKALEQVADVIVALAQVEDLLAHPTYSDLQALARGLDVIESCLNEARVSGAGMLEFILESYVTRLQETITDICLTQ